MNFTKETRKNWRINTERAILRLNTAIGNDLTGENFYELGFRGRAHNPVLILDGIVVRRGMIAITEYLYTLMKYYNLI